MKSAQKVRNKKKPVKSKQPKQLKTISAEQKVDVKLVKNTVTSFNKKRWYIGIGLIMLLVFCLNAGLLLFLRERTVTPTTQIVNQPPMYWFMLHRASEKEYLYRGIPGEPQKSTLLKTFSVKVGIPHERPTPLPQLLGRKYWRVIDKMEQFDNPETFPYFLTLDVPVPSTEPFGPSPYTECNGQQCNWMLPGAFGLHGVASDSSRLSKENPGSSGCIRHTDEDITYLYNLLDPAKEEIRYYIEDK